MQVRVNESTWVDAELERPLSEFTWTRWRATIAMRAQAGDTVQVEARARDGDGNWQAVRERPLFPDGMEGPTVRRVTL